MKLLLSSVFALILGASLKANAELGFHCEGKTLRGQSVVVMGYFELNSTAKSSVLIKLANSEEPIQFEKAKFRELQSAVGQFSITLYSGILSLNGDRFSIQTMDGKIGSGKLQLANGEYAKGLNCVISNGAVVGF